MGKASLIRSRATPEPLQLPNIRPASSSSSRRAACLAYRRARHGRRAGSTDSARPAHDDRDAASARLLTDQRGARVRSHGWPQQDHVTAATGAAIATHPVAAFLAHVADAWPRKSVRQADGGMSVHSMTAERSASVETRAVTPFTMFVANCVHTASRPVVRRRIGQSRSSDPLAANCRGRWQGMRSVVGWRAGDTARGGGNRCRAGVAALIGALIAGGVALRNEAQRRAAARHDLEWQAVGSLGRRRASVYLHVSARDCWLTRADLRFRRLRTVTLRCEGWCSGG
jgi:hypothetical protein